MSPDQTKPESDRDLLALLVDQSSTAMAIWGPELACLHANRAFLDFFGIKVDTGLGSLSFAEQIPESDAEGREEIARLIAGQISLLQRDQVYPQETGPERWAQLSLKATSDQTGRPRYLISNLIDISDRKRSELALEKREALYRLITDNQTDYVFLYDAQGRVVYDSPSVVRLLGDQYIKDRALAATNTLLHPDDAEWVREAFMNFLVSGTTGSSLSYRWVTPWNEVLWVESRGCKIPGANGRTERVLVTARDVTERELFRQELEQFRNTLDEIRDAVFMFDSETLLFTYVNKGACEQVGYTAEELARMRPFDLKPLFSPEEFRNFLAPLLRGQEKSLRFETIHRHKDGSDVPVEIFLQLVKLPGQRDRLVALVTDISEKRAAQRAALEQSALLEMVLNNAGVGLAATTNRVIDWANPLFHTMFGYQPGELIGQSTRVLFPDEQAFESRTTSEIPRVKAGETVEADRQMLRKDGSLVWTRIVSTLAPTSGTGDRLITAIQDITERHRLEERARVMQRLEAIGQLTGGLAHDFNNLLSVVVGNLDMVEEQLGIADGEALKRFNAARQAALRGAEVTRSLLAVARRQALELQRHDVNQLLRDMLPLFKTSAGGSVTLIMELAEGEIWTRLDAAGFSNAVLNLVINARDAMQHVNHDRILAISTRRVQGAQGSLQNLTPGPYVQVTVSDTGVGMSKAVSTQAFEPFFTTKERDKGTGLGLAMVYGFAEQLGGSAKLTSRLGEGTSVSLYLPLETLDSANPSPRDTEQVFDAAKALHTIEAADQVGAEQTKSGDNETPVTRVLVVDDEEALCDLACVWLESLGYQVKGVYGPMQAMAALRAERFDALFSDVVMPGSMDGIALARDALQICPWLRVVLTSGYAQSLVDAQGTEMPGPVLNKPYRKPDLARMFPPCDVSG